MPSSRRSSRLAWWLAGAALLPVGCGGTGAAKPPPSPVGMWTAHGRVLASYLPRQEPVGTSFDRSWLFERRCATPGHCVLTLVRQAQFSTEVAAVTQDGDTLVATFTVTDDASCIRGVHGTVHRHFRIRLQRDARLLQADELVDASYPGCGPGGGTSHPAGHLSWTATRVAPAADEIAPPSGTSA